MVFDSPPLPGEGIEGLWGKDIGSFIRKSSDALLLRCSDAEVGQDRASDFDRPSTSHSHSRFTKSPKCVIISAYL